MVQSVGETQQIPSLTRRRSRGAVLFECMLALALLIAAGVTVLACLDQAQSAVQAHEEASQAVRVAQAALSLMDAGVITPETVQGPVSKWRPGVGGVELVATVETQPSEFTGLTQITIRVTRPNASADARPLATLHGLIDLNSSRARSGAAGDESPQSGSAESEPIRADPPVRGDARKGQPGARGEPAAEKRRKADRR
jgi:hypothetical protein